MKDDLAIRRFNNTKSAANASPQDALQVALSELEEEEIVSVVIIGVDKEGKQITYYAGPHIATLRQLWLVLQSEVLRIMEKMVNSRN